MKKLIAALILALPNLAIADGLFLDLGIGYVPDADKNLGVSCISDYDSYAKVWGCSDNPLGYIGLGYGYRGFSLSAEHWSSLGEVDAGLNIFSIKYRFSLQ
jgi:hypothetical protein